MKKWLILLLLLCVPLVGSADEFPFEPSDVRDGALLGAGIALEGAALVLHSRAEDPAGTIGDRREVNPLDRIATYQWSPDADTASGVLDYTLLGLPVLFYFDERVQSRPMFFALLYLESALLNDGLKNVVKELVERKRPFNYGHRAPMSARTTRGAELSFYSGHTAQAFNAAVFCGMVFQELYPESPWRWVVWSGGLATAATVGFLRVYAGKHYPTDVIAGAIAGSLTGWLVPFLAKKRDLPVTIVPGGAGEVWLTVIGKF